MPTPERATAPAFFLAFSSVSEIGKRNRSKTTKYRAIPSRDHRQNCRLPDSHFVSTIRYLPVSHRIERLYALVDGISSVVYLPRRGLKIVPVRNRRKRPIDRKGEEGFSLHIIVASTPCRSAFFLQPYAEYDRAKLSVKTRKVRIEMAANDFTLGCVC